MGPESNWRRLGTGAVTYIMKREHVDNVFRVAVSNLVHVWVNESSSDELMNLFQSLNPLIECDDSSIVLKIWSSLDEEGGSDIDFVDDRSLKLKLRVVIDGLSFKLHLVLSQQNPAVFFKEVVKPLLSSAEELLVRQDLLCSLLEKKDTEIAQYKLEGASLSRLNVETQPFSKTEFVSKRHKESIVPDPYEKILKVLHVANSWSAKSHSESSEVKSHVVDQITSTEEGNKNLDVPESEIKQEVPCENLSCDESSDIPAAHSNTKVSSINVSKKKKIKLNL